MDIFSKRSGPRREDVAARRLIEANRGTIERLADQISGGGYSAGKAAAAAPAQPEASGLIVSDLRGPRRSDAPQPYVRISPNRRVVVVDDATSRQMHHLGELRRVGGRMTFVLATRANGFFSPLDATLAERLAPLDGAAIDAAAEGARTEASLAGEIGALLGY